MKVGSKIYNVIYIISYSTLLLINAFVDFYFSYCIAFNISNLETLGLKFAILLHERNPCSALIQSEPYIFLSFQLGRMQKSGNEIYAYYSLMPNFKILIIYKIWWSQSTLLTRWITDLVTHSEYSSLGQNMNCTPIYAFGMQIMPVFKVIQSMSQIFKQTDR